MCEENVTDQSQTGKFENLLARAKLISYDGLFPKRPSNPPVVITFNDQDDKRAQSMTFECEMDRIDWIKDFVNSLGLEIKHIQYTYTVEFETKK
jgi:hypothetical protein